MSKAAPKDKFIYVAISALVLSSLNPRKYISSQGIETLADGIGAAGKLATPLAVRAQENGTYEVIAGERRTRALRLLVERGTFKDSDTFAAVVHKVDDLEALQIAIAENSEREDIHPMEEADAFLALEKMGLSVDDIFQKTGKSKDFIRSRLGLARQIAPTTRQLFMDGKISLDQARVLASVSPDEQESYLRQNAVTQYDVTQLTPISDEEAEELANSDVPYFEDDDGQFYSIPEGVEEVVVSYRLYGAVNMHKELNGGKVPLERAEFPVKDYLDRKGAISGNFFTGEFFDNRTLFNELQQEAMTRLQIELHKEGLNVYKLDKPYDDKMKFGENKGAVTLWIGENGELRRMNDFGPTYIRRDEAEAILEAERAQAAAANAKTPGGPKQNTKRIRLEDKAINQAVESSVMASPRLAFEVLVLSYLGVSGLRLRVDSGFMNPHEGYHASVAIAPVARFYAALESAGVKLTGHHGSKDGEPLLHFDTYGTYSAYMARKDEDENAPRVDSVAEARKVLASYSDDEVALLAQAFITLSMSHVHDGTATDLQKIVLEVAKPNVPEFFVRDDAYLAACKNAELAEIYDDLGSNILHDKKKDRVAYISGTLAEKYAAYIPPRLAEFVPDPGVPTQVRELEA